MKQPSLDLSEDASSLFSGSKESSSVSRVSIDAPQAEIISHFQEFRISYAYEKHLSKEKCGLCKMYFNRHTVKYKVPNHRIHELHKKWKGGNGGLEGRRYQSPSFLYTTTIVCTFCSQFFWILPDEMPEEVDDELALLKPKPPGPKLEFETEIERTNIAEGQKTYQSSMVDNKLPGYAIMPPYELTSRTRREVDPWWEIDFGRSQQIQSLSCEVLVGIRQLIHVHVFLLDKPMGFEDPFLDNMKKRNVHMFDKAFPLEDKARFVSIDWELPAHTSCFAIRVQLKGMQTLGVRKFIVYQGDDFVATTEQDEKISMNSYAAIPMTTIRDSLKEYALMDRKPTPLNVKDAKGDRMKKLRLNEERVQALSVTTHDKYTTLEQWKSRAIEAAKDFNEEEIMALYKIIFKYSADLNAANVGHHNLNEHDLLDSALIQHYPRSDLKELHTRLRSIMRWLQTRTHLKQLGALLNSEQLNIAAVSADEAIFQLMNAIKRIEYYWDKKEKVEKEKNLKLQLIQQQQERVSSAQGGKRNGSSPGRAGTAGANIGGAVTGAIPMQVSKVAEQRGCSWTQFLIIMNLFCKNQCYLIPEMAFNIHNPRVKMGLDRGVPDDLLSRSSHYTYHSNDGSSVSSFSVSLPGNKGTMSRSMSMGADQTKSFLEGTNKSPLAYFLEQKSAKAALAKPLAQQVRESGTFHPFDSRFSEYKFGHFKKKQLMTNIDFPKELSLEFAASLIPTKNATVSYASQSHDDLYLGGNLDNSIDLAGGASALNDDRSQGSGGSQSDLLAEFGAVGGGGGSASRPPLTRGNTAMSMPRLVKQKTGGIEAAGSFMSGNGKSALNILSPIEATTPMKARTPAPKTPKTHFSGNASDSFDDFDFDDDSNGGSMKQQELKNIDFFRVCSLCELRLPRASIDIKVLRKHVVKLRSTWDPKLVSKEVRMLDNTISMYNLVNVCLFCAQFFDPDFPDGIAYPVKVSPEKTASKNKSIFDAIQSQSESKPLVPFYDTRYLANPIEVGDVLSRPATTESRHRAKRVTEIAHEVERRLHILDSPSSPN